MGDDLRQTIEGLIDSEAVRFDIEIGSHRFLRVLHTRELLADDIRDAMLSNWRETLCVLSELLDDGRIDFSGVEGLCVKQSDRGFDAGDLVWSQKRGHVHGNYRW
jgi:hypothetical protein